ncbi:MAG: Holliday junction branch migration protein RuvA [bacterium]|nr:Holliday junction branch migration protein RuvA [bacterium]
MIGYLEGKVIDTADKSLVVLVQGVGYRVFATTGTLKKASGNISLFTYLAVRENALDLFGFLEKDELNFFELLITIPGIGPKSALAILNIASLATLRSAVASSDIGYLTKVSGIGRKTAEKIILELRDKVGTMTTESKAGLKEESDALLALMSLGYGERDVREVLKQINKPGTPTQEIVREALKQLGK